MNTALDQLLEEFLIQLHQWRQQLAINTIDPEQLETIVLELHNSLDLINSYQVTDFNRSHIVIIKDISKCLDKVSDLIALLKDNASNKKMAKIDTSFKLYGHLGSK